MVVVWRFGLFRHLCYMYVSIMRTNDVTRASFTLLHLNLFNFSQSLLLKQIFIHLSVFSIRYSAPQGSRGVLWKSNNRRVRFCHQTPYSMRCIMLAVHKKSYHPPINHHDVVIILATGWLGRIGSCPNAPIPGCIRDLRFIIFNGWRIIFLRPHPS